MDWAWDSTSHKGTQTKRAGIKKLKEEWIWQPVKLGPAGRYGAHQTGALLEDEVYPCAFCNGTGAKPKGSKCSACKGKGVVAVDPPAVTCAYCKGRGEEKPRSNVTCTACKGHGVIQVEEPIEICPHCQGAGKEPTNKLVCITCRGKGVVTVPAEEDEETEEEIKEPGVPAQAGFQSGKAEQDKPIGSASGSERDALEVVKELGRADRVAVGRHMAPPVSSPYAEQLCNALVRKRLLTREGLFYSPAMQAGH